MKSTKQIRARFRSGCVVLFLLGGLSATPSPSLEIGGEALGGLRMTISLERTVGEHSMPDFKLDLRNVGDTDLVLNLGVMLANGKRQYLTAVTLRLTETPGKARKLNLREPMLISGRVDPLIVPLPAGATFSIPLNLDRYWAAESQEFDYRPHAGSYSLEAQFTGKEVSLQEANLDVKGIALMPYWEGTVESNQLRFDIPSK